jgi:ketosteroid isomerase-like protein
VLDARGAECLPSVWGTPLVTSAATEAVVRSLYAAYAANDVGTIDSLIAEDAVVHVPGNQPLTGDHRGKQAVWAYLGKVAEIAGGAGGFELHGVTSDDEGHAVALMTGTIREWIRPVVHVCLIRDGRVSQLWEVYLDQPAEDRFWTAAVADL